MWDWELLKSGSGTHACTKLAQYSNENFQYAHAISDGSQEDVFFLHNHAMYELVYHISGDVTYLAEGMTYQLEPGSLLLIAPTIPHKLFVCSDKPFERHILYVYYSGNDSPLSAMMAQCHPPIWREQMGSMYYAPQDATMLLGSFKHTADCCNEADETLRRLTPVFVETLIAQLLMIVRKKSPAKFSRTSATTVDTMLSYLNQSFTRKISLQDVADRFHITRDYCNRAFRKAVGMTVMQYVIYNRVLYAKHLLADGHPAAQVAEEAGFSDYSNFYRAYRNITGRSPREDHKLTAQMLETPDSVAFGRSSSN